MTGRRFASRAGRTVAALVAVGFIALLVYGVLTQAPDTGIDDGLARSEKPAAPGFALPVLHAGRPGPALRSRLERAMADGSVGLAELRGAPVVLNFWASWCIPCQEEAPLLEQAWRRARRDGVLFLGLNMQDATEDARGFIARFDNSYLNVRDKSNDVAREYGVTGLPETFFISSRGEIVGHVIGVVSREQLVDGIAAAKAGRTMGAGTGGDRRPLR